MKAQVVATAFSVAGQAIPMVMDEPVKSLTRVYNDASLTDKDTEPHIRDMMGRGLWQFLLW